MEALDNPSYFSMTSDGRDSDAEAGTVRGGRSRVPSSIGGCDQQGTGKPVRRSSDSLSLLSATLAESATASSGGAYYNLNNKRHSTATLPRTAAAIRSTARHQVEDQRLVVENMTETAKLLDIALVLCSGSQDATIWADYLVSCFQEIAREESKPPFKLARVMAESVLLGLPVEGSSGSRLQIVIVCPKFLSLLSGSQTGLPILAAMLRPGTVLALLLGLTPSALENHQYAGLFKFEQWRKMVVKDKDKTFVGDFLGVAMDVLSRSWQLQQAIHQVRVDSSRSHFSIVPKKIKVGQNKLLILLNDPLCNSDKISISVERTEGNRLEVGSIKRRNPYTLQFSMPSVCLQSSQLVAVLVERNGRSIGHRLVKCECRLRELDQLLRSTDSPLAFMCQALGINGGDRDQLDSFLVAAFQKNIPPNFNLLNGTTLANPGTTPASNCQSREEFPTLLHFGARFGLERLCWQLLEVPGGESAAGMQNCTGLTPSQLAQKYGHSGLAHSLSSYMQMTELSSMYTYMNAYLKNSSEEKSPDLRDTNYLLPRPLSDTYLVPPKARPVTPPPPQATTGCPSYSSSLEEAGTQGLRCWERGSASRLASSENYQYPPPAGCLGCSSRGDTHLSQQQRPSFDNYQSPLPGPARPSPPPGSCSCSSLEDHAGIPTPTSLPTRRQPPSALRLPIGCETSSDNYQSPVAPARPFTPLSPTVSTPTSPLIPSAFSQYLHMHSPMSDSSSSNFDNILTPEKKYSSFPGSDGISIASSGGGGGHGYMKTSGGGGRGGCVRDGTGSCSSSGGSTSSCRGLQQHAISPDEELAEIMTDFKNNVYTIAELESLVEQWKNRNDVQQSFREKKEQINQMRLEYERIQLKMKEQLKRPTPFDRIKKFFSRKSKPGCEHEGKERCRDGVCHRPLSSLSLHSSCSSSSSGRMSTTSGLSTGTDSGTHSDPEDKKAEVMAEKRAMTQANCPSAAFYERVQRQESLPDEYVPAVGGGVGMGGNLPHQLSNPGSQLITSPLLLPQPPGFISCTLAQVHRSSSSSELLEESTEETSDQTVKTIGTGRTSTIQSSENSDSSQLYLNTNSSSSTGDETKENSEDPIKNEDEMRILEQSERLLKDMANTLPNKDNEDILSPPESAFINENTNIHLDDTLVDDLITGEDEESEEDKEYVNVHKLDVNRYSELASAKGKESTASTKELTLTKEKLDDALDESSEDENSPLLSNTAPTNDSLVLNDNYHDNILDSVFYNKLHEYVNVGGCLPPPIPPRCKYKSVLL